MKERAVIFNHFGAVGAKVAAIIGASDARPRFAWDIVSDASVFL